MIKNTKKKLKTLCYAMALPLALVGGFVVTPSLATNAEDNVVTFSHDHVEEVNISNNSFKSISGVYASGNSFTGWNAIDSSSRASGMIIDVGTSFSSYRNSYYLNNNPNKSGSDDKILMINSKNSTKEEDVFAKQGYSSNEITLEANSYYKFSVDVKTSLDGSTSGVYSAYASVYINGLRDKDNKPIEFSYEGINNTTWKTYYFFIATGSSAQTVTMDLYLGSDTSTSTGAVFFDEAHLERYAKSTFYTTIQSSTYGYEFKDNLTDDNAKTKFLVDGLIDKNAVLDMSGYNFDFEDLDTGINSLGNAWTRSSASTGGHAGIMPVGKNVMQPAYFKETTGYDFVGYDLDYNQNTRKENAKALVLYTTSPSNVTVQSKAFDIKAHGLYKLSVNVKVSEIKSGSFNIIVKENDSIYSKYSINKDNYKLDSYSKTISNTNVSNAFKNDYTTIDIYIKGHDFYDTSVNLEFALGSNEETAQGCVVVDNITLSYVDYNAYSSASDKKEFSAYTPDTSNLPNNLFNITENEEAKLSYPLKAQNWTATKPENANVESGVIYLKDGLTYEEMYADYSWKASFPKHPNGDNSPNNVYMMYNGTASYQSLKSGSYTLEGSTSSEQKYYKLAFDYKTVSTSHSKDAQFALEIVDENGIQLFYQDGFNARDWNYGNMEVYFHTGISAPTNISVVIHFGEEEDKVAGYLYLDNFEITSSTQSAFTDASYNVDLTDYLLNLDPKGSVGFNLTDSSAYKFEIDSTSTSTQNSAVGGIVSGKENEFGVTVEDSNILVLSAATQSKSTLTSVYKFKLEEGKYYRLNFDLRTIFNIDEDAIKANKEHDCKYGVSVGLSGFDLATKLKSNDMFETYTIILKANTAGNQNFTFTLDCDCNESIGSAYLTHISFTETTENDFNSASTSDKFEKTLFTSNEINASDDENPDDKPSDDNTTPTASSDALWLIIPSVIFGVALLIAIIGYALRHVKIKKNEKITRESYDKKINVNHDAILIKAQAERDAEAEEIRHSIKAVIESREALEKEHKEAVRAARATSNGKITKDTEKQFKAYAGKIARLNEKENILKEQLDTTLSADHLIDIENRLAAEEEKMLREMEKLQAGKTKQKNTDSEE